MFFLPFKIPYSLELLLIFIPIVARYNKRKIISSISAFVFSIIFSFFFNFIITNLNYSFNDNLLFDYLLDFIGILPFGIIIFFPSVFEAMPFRLAIKAILPDIFISSVLLLFFGWQITLFYSGVRLWSINFGIIPPPKEKSFGASSEIWQMLTFAGRGLFCFLASIAMVMFWSHLSYMNADFFTKFIIGIFLFCLTLITLLRLTKYLRMILPIELRPLLEIVYLIPGIAGIVGVLFVKFIGADFDMDASGFDADFGDASMGEGIDITGDGIIDGFDVNHDGLIDTNILGYNLGPLQSVSGYIRSDGTFVNPYLRTVADDSLLNNLRPKL